jgi:hypothetical protein
MPPRSDACWNSAGVDFAAKLRDANHSDQRLCASELGVIRPTNKDARRHYGLRTRHAATFPRRIATTSCGPISTTSSPLITSPVGLRPSAVSHPTNTSPKSGLRSQTGSSSTRSTDAGTKHLAARLRSVSIGPRSSECLRRASGKLTDCCSLRYRRGGSLSVSSSAPHSQTVSSGSGVGPC